jgi:RNA polymerase sigma-70 factor (ECF subfamily)
MSRSRTGSLPSRLEAEMGQLFRVAYRFTGSVPDAEDLVQNCLERALEKAPDFAEAADCRRWLLRVLYNGFIDEKRRQRRSPIVPLPVTNSRPTDTPSSADNPEQLAEQVESEIATARAWERLEKDQQALLMLRAEGHNLDEIRKITGIEKDALSSRLYRARSSFSKYLDEEKSESVAGAVSGRLG